MNIAIIAILGILALWLIIEKIRQLLTYATLLSYEEFIEKANQNFFLEDSEFKEKFLELIKFLEKTKSHQALKVFSQYLLFLNSKLATLFDQGTGDSSITSLEKLSKFMARLEKLGYCKETRNTVDSMVNGEEGSGDQSIMMLYVYPALSLNLTCKNFVDSAIADLDKNSKSDALLAIKVFSDRQKALNDLFSHLYAPSRLETNLSIMEQKLLEAIWLAMDNKKLQASDAVFIRENVLVKLRANVPTFGVIQRLNELSKKLEMV